jgi:hypothetical protein
MSSERRGATHLEMRCTCVGLEISPSARDAFLVALARSARAQPLRGTPFSAGRRATPQSDALVHAFWRDKTTPNPTLRGGWVVYLLDHHCTSALVRAGRGGGATDAEDLAALQHQLGFGEGRRQRTRSRHPLEALVGQRWHLPVAYQQSNTDQQMSFRKR